MAWTLRRIKKKKKTNWGSLNSFNCGEESEKDESRPLIHATLSKQINRERCPTGCTVQGENAFEGTAVDSWLKSLTVYIHVTHQTVAPWAEAIDTSNGFTA